MATPEETATQIQASRQQFESAIAQASQPIFFSQSQSTIRESMGGAASAQASRAAQEAARQQYLTKTKGEFGQFEKEVAGFEQAYKEYKQQQAQYEAQLAEYNRQKAEQEAAANRSLKYATSEKGKGEIVKSIQYALQHDQLSKKDIERYFGKGATTEKVFVSGTGWTTRVIQPPSGPTVETSADTYATIVQKYNEALKSAEKSKQTELAARGALFSGDAWTEKQKQDIQKRLDQSTKDRTMYENAAESLRKSLYGNVYVTTKPFNLTTPGGETLSIKASSNAPVNLYEAFSGKYTVLRPEVWDTIRLGRGADDRATREGFLKLTQQNIFAVPITSTGTTSIQQPQPNTIDYSKTEQVTASTGGKVVPGLEYPQSQSFGGGGFGGAGAVISNVVSFPFKAYESFGQAIGLLPTEQQRGIITVTSETGEKQKFLAGELPPPIPYLQPKQEPRAYDVISLGTDILRGGAALGGAVIKYTPPVAQFLYEKYPVFGPFTPKQVVTGITAGVQEAEKAVQQYGPKIVTAAAPYVPTLLTGGIPGVVAQVTTPYVVKYAPEVAKTVYEAPILGLGVPSISGVSPPITGGVSIKQVVEGTGQLAERYGPQIIETGKQILPYTPPLLPFTVAAAVTKAAEPYVVKYAPVVGSILEQELKREALPYVIAGGLAVKGAEKVAQAAPVIAKAVYEAPIFGAPGIPPVGISPRQVVEFTKAAAPVIGRGLVTAAEIQALPYVVAGGLAAKGVEKIVQITPTVAKAVYEAPIVPTPFGIISPKNVITGAEIGAEAIKKYGPQVIEWTAKTAYEKAPVIPTPLGYITPKQAVTGLGIGVTVGKEAIEKYGPGIVKGAKEALMTAVKIQQLPTELAILGVSKYGPPIKDFAFGRYSDISTESRDGTIIKYVADRKEHDVKVYEDGKLVRTMSQPEYESQAAMGRQLSYSFQGLTPKDIEQREALAKIKEYNAFTTFGEGLASIPGSVGKMVGAIAEKGIELTEKPDYYITPQGQRVWASDLKEGFKVPKDWEAYQTGVQLGQPGYYIGKIPTTPEEISARQEKLSRLATGAVDVGLAIGLPGVYTGIYTPDILQTLALEGPQKTWEKRGWEIVGVGTANIAPLLKWAPEKVIKLAGGGEMIIPAKYVIPPAVKNWMIFSTTPLGRELNLEASKAIKNEINKEQLKKYASSEVEAIKIDTQNLFDTKYKNDILSGKITYEKAKEDFLASKEYQDKVNEYNKKANENQNWLSGLKILGLKTVDFLTPESPLQVLTSGAVVSTLAEPTGVLRATSFIKGYGIGRAALTGLEGYTTYTGGKQFFDIGLPKEERILGGLFGTVSAIGLAQDIKGYYDFFRPNTGRGFTSGRFPSDIEAGGTGVSKRYALEKPVLSDVSDINEGRTLVMTKSGKIKDISEAGYFPESDKAKAFLNYGLNEDGSLEVQYIKSYQKGKGIGTDLVNYLQSKYPDRYLSAASASDTSGFYKSTGWELVDSKKGMTFWKKMPEGLSPAQEEKLIYNEAIKHNDKLTEYGLKLGVSKDELRNMQSSYGTRVTGEVYDSSGNLIRVLDKKSLQWGLPGGAIEFKQGQTLMSPRESMIKELGEEIFGGVSKIKSLGINQDDLEYVGFFGGERNHIIYRLVLTDEQLKALKPGSDVIKLGFVNPESITAGTQSSVFVSARAPQGIKEWLSYPFQQGGGLYNSDAAQIVNKFQELPKIQKEISLLTAAEKSDLYDDAIKWISTNYGKQFVSSYPGEKAIQEYLLAKKGLAGAQIATLGKYNDYFESAAGKTTFVERVPAGQPGAGQFKRFETKTLTFELPDKKAVKVWQDVIFVAPGSEYKFELPVGKSYVQGTMEQILHGTRGQPSTITPLLGKEFEVEQKFFFQPPLYPKGPYYLGYGYLGMGGTDAEAFTLVRKAPTILLGYEKTPSTIIPSKAIGELVTTGKTASGQELEYIYQPGTRLAYLNKYFGPGAPLGGEKVNIRYVASLGKAPLTPFEKAEEALVIGEQAIEKAIPLLSPMTSSTVAKTYISPSILASEAYPLISISTPTKQIELSAPSLAIPSKETPKSLEASPPSFTPSISIPGEEKTRGGGESSLTKPIEPTPPSFSPYGPSRFDFPPSRPEVPPSRTFAPTGPYPGLMIIPSKEKKKKEEKKPKKKIIPKGYEVLIRRKKKFVEAAPYSFATKEEAVSFGARKVLQEAAATFQVRPSQKPVKEVTVPSFPVGEYFRPPKTPMGPETYVQKERKRIVTAGEKREISLAGVAARTGRPVMGPSFTPTPLTIRRPVSTTRTPRPSLPKPKSTATKPKTVPTKPKKSPTNFLKSRTVKGGRAFFT